jgi:hypothetical protein
MLGTRTSLSQQDCEHRIAWPRSLVSKPLVCFKSVGCGAGSTAWSALVYAPHSRDQNGGHWVYMQGLVAGGCLGSLLSLMTSVMVVSREG